MQPIERPIPCAKSERNKPPAEHPATNLGNIVLFKREIYVGAVTIT